MFTFPVSAVRAVIMRGRIDAFLNGGFRNPHYGLAPGKDEKPGVWLVGDEGVYIMSNGGPGTSTETLAYLDFNAFHVDYDYGYGGAISLVLIVLCLAIAAAYTRLFRERG